MKIYGYLLIIFLLVSCNGNRQNQPVANGSESPTPAAESANVIRKSMPYVGDFIMVNNMGTVNVVYTQGPSNIEVEGPEMLVNLVKVSVDSGVLIISMSNERNKDVQIFQGNRPNVTAYVSSPNLNMIAVCSGGDFVSKGIISTDKMHIGSLSNGKIVIDSLECDELKFEVNSVGESTIGCARISGDCLILSSGTGKLRVEDIEVGGKLTLDDINNSTLYCKGKTADLEINNQGSGLSEFEGTYLTKNVFEGKDASVIIH